MQREVTQLQVILQQLITEHGKLLEHLCAQQAAMKKMDMPALEQITGLADATRMRIVALDGKRRALVQLLASMLKLQGAPKLTRLADALPQHKEVLLKLR